MRGDCARACYESRDVADCRAGFFQEFYRFVEVRRGFAGIAYDKVCAEREFAETFRKGVGECRIVACGVAAVHCFENSLAPALDGNVNKLVNALVRKAVQERFLIAEHMAWVAHAEADAVIAAHMRENPLREFGKVCADVKAVAGAVLAGELDFKATVIDERLDLIDDGVWRKAVESAFDEMCAAEGAGIEAALFDVHDADVGRFAKDVVTARFYGFGRG